MGETVPENIDVWTTQYPGPQHAPLVPGTEGIIIDVAQAEFDVLRARFDIDVPEVSLSATPTAEGNPSITVTTPVVEGETFTPGWEWPKQAADAPNQEQAADLAERLIAYYRRVFMEQPEFFLGGIAQAQNYAVTPDGRLTLVNPIPLMISGRVRGNIQAQMAMVKDWVRNIQFTDPRREDDLRSRVNTFMDILETRG
jgi:hypothetical protein